jgi:hypothetical protein
MSLGGVAHKKTQYINRFPVSAPARPYGMKLAICIFEDYCIKNTMKQQTTG